MNKSIVTYPSEGLLRKVMKVTDFDEPLTSLVDNMLLVMMELKGVGIAANQIGVNKAVFIAKTKFDIMVFVNPVIIDQHNFRQHEEGCLSLPGKSYRVPRPTSVTISYQTMEGEPKSLVTSDPLLSAILSHEMDHLEGALLSDYCKHYDCMCNYYKNRKGSLDSGDIESLRDMRRKFGSNKNSCFFGLKLLHTIQG